MIQLSKYAKLLAEGKLTAESFDNKLKAAIQTIFDVDVVSTKKAKQFDAPEFAHSYFNSVLFFEYKTVPIKIVVHFYHLKIKNIDLDTSKKEWDDIIKKSNSIQTIETSDDVLKVSNPYVMLTASISYNPNTDDSSMFMDQDFRTYHLGSVKSNNIRDLITDAKKLIDDLGDDGGNDGDDEPEPVTPTPTSGNLVTV
jgi:hypothetical protein